MLSKSGRISIQESFSMSDILKVMGFDSWLILDLDNTVMESRIELGSDQWFTKLIEHAPQVIPNKDEAIASVISVYHAVQKHVRTQEVEPNISYIIKALQDIGIPVLALTSRSESIAESTFRQLHDIGIDFSKNHHLNDDRVELGADMTDQCLYHKGIIFCGGNEKGKCLTVFLEQCDKRPPHVVMVDDKEKHLTHVKHAIESFGIRFNGFRYGLLDEKIKQFEIKSAHVQLAHIQDKLSSDAKVAVKKLKLIPSDVMIDEEQFSHGFFKGVHKKSIEKKSQLHRVNTNAGIAIHGSDPTIFQGQPYEMLTHKLPMTPFSKVSCRGGERETILVDLQSESLKKIFDDFIKQYVSSSEEDLDATQPYDSSGQPIELPGKNGEKNQEIMVDLPQPFDLKILQYLAKYVGSKMRSTSEEAIKKFTAQESADLKLSDKKPVVLLELFWKRQSGYCRHRVLATAHLLVNLVDYHAKQNGKNFFETGSKIYRFRTKLQPLDKLKPSSSHAVIIYEAENGHRYLLDSSKFGNKKLGICVDLTALDFVSKQELLECYLPYDGELFIQEIMTVYDGLSKKSKADFAYDDERLVKKHRF